MSETRKPLHVDLPRGRAQSDLQEALDAARTSPAELDEALNAARGRSADRFMAELDRDLSYAVERETDPGKRAQLRRAVELGRDAAYRTAIEIIAKAAAELAVRGLGS